MTTKARQIELEELYSKHQLIPKIESMFQEYSDELQETYEQFDIDPKLGLKTLVHLCIHKRATPSMLFGMLLKHEDQLEAIASNVDKMVQAGMITYEPNQRIFITKVDFDDETKEQISLYQNPLPLFIKPRVIKSNFQSGYYTRNESVILNQRPIGLDCCLEHLNRINGIALTINEDTASKVRIEFKHPDRDPGMDSATWNAKKANMERLSQAIVRDTQQTIDEGNRFYLNHRYDKRGRQYCEGTSVTYQGMKFQQAIVELFSKEYIRD